MNIQSNKQVPYIIKKKNEKGFRIIQFINTYEF
jgi:hypothetical protein